ncbi:Alpha/Beta hydrolase protein [Aspergillus keveii]|uniref:Alpha/Beta hydrolase protein n=1 Tax=Aspergillus keveii TaxID=714993 RepID=A0ABR4FZ65_9EURO
MASTPDLSNSQAEHDNPDINRNYDGSTQTIPGATMGRHTAFQLAGQHMITNLERLESINPSSGAMFWKAVLTALGDCADQVEIYTEAALKHGATEDEILAVINHASSFAGTPRAVNTMRRIAGTLASARQFERPRETVVRLRDHDTLIREYSPGAAGTPIILIHALSMDGRMFTEVAPSLTSAGRVITYDLRGHGYARGAPLTTSLDHLVDDLKQLVDILDIEKADVYGASYGGAVAQYFTLAHPSRVRSLCTMATSAQGHPLLATRATRAEEGHMQELVAEAIIRWFLPETIALNPWFVRYARANVEQVRVEEWAAAWRAMAALDCLHRIPEISVPILVLAGKQDASATPEHMKPIYQESPNGTYVELDPGTHMMVMEQPEAVANALLNFRKVVDEKC